MSSMRPAGARAITTSPLPVPGPDPTLLPDFRGLLTLTYTGTLFPEPPTHFAYYPVSDTEFFFISTDSHVNTSAALRRRHRADRPAQHRNPQWKLSRHGVSRPPAATAFQSSAARSTRRCALSTATAPPQRSSRTRTTRARSARISSRQPWPTPSTPQAA